MWVKKVKDAFPRLEPSPKAKGRRQSRGEALFARECYMAFRNLPRFSNLSRHRKELYRELVVCSASDPLLVRLGWSLEETRFQWRQVRASRTALSSRSLSGFPGMRCPSTTGLSERAWQTFLSLRQWFGINVFARLLLL